MAARQEKIPQKTFRTLRKISLDSQPAAMQKALFTIAQTLADVETCTIVVRAKDPPATGYKTLIINGQPMVVQKQITISRSPEHTPNPLHRIGNLLKNAKKNEQPVYIAQEIASRPKRSKGRPNDTFTACLYKGKHIADYNRKKRRVIYEKAQITPEEKRILTRLLQGKKYDQIQLETEIPRGSITSHLSRAKNKLTHA